MSDYTGTDGKYSLRVNEGGTYYLMIMGGFGSVFSGSGMSVSYGGEEVDAGVILRLVKLRGRLI